MEGITVTRECCDQQGICWPPLMELMRSIRLVHAGEVLAVLVDDQESRELIPLWLSRAREELLGVEPAGSATRFIVRKTH